MSIVAIIPAAGSGKRMKSRIEKQYMLLGGKPVMVHALETLALHPRIDRIILAVSPSRIKFVQNILRTSASIQKPVQIVKGGAERFLTVKNALSALKPSDNLIVIHDAVRPFLRAEQIDAAIDAAKKYPAVCLAMPVANTVKRAKGDLAMETVDRKDLWSIQTPQVFKRTVLVKAFAAAERKGDFGTDECYIVEKLGIPVKLVTGSPENFKITTPEDLSLAEKLMHSKDLFQRIGTGFDVHPLVKGRKLVIGGETLAHPKGLMGHSDADVLCHAIADSVLGALALGDIGKHFPNTDPKYRGISSLKLLEQVRRLVEKSGYSIANVDSTVVAEKPKLAPHITAMRANIAKSLGIQTDRVSVKATTSEKLGYEGREEGISAQAVALVYGK